MHFSAITLVLLAVSDARGQAPVAKKGSLSITAVQVHSVNDLVLRITLTNTSNRPVLVISNPRIDGWDGEITFSFQDVRARRAPFLCKINRRSLVAENRSLAPHDSLVFEHRVERSCYIFDAAECLGVIVSYKPPATKHAAFADAVDSDWIDIVVPDKWPGAAAPGCPTRR